MIPSTSSAPSAKRRKVELEGENPQPKVRWNQPQAKPISAQSRPSQDSRSEFPLRSLEEFYKTCPTYRLPVEIGCFSLDDEGRQKLDNSQLRYYTASPSPSSRLNFDLKVGYDKYIPANRNVPSDKLNPILRWIAVNGDCFRPKLFSPKSSETSTTEERRGGEGVANGSEEDRRRISVGMGIVRGIVSPTVTAKDRPDNLLTNFITWRGMITKMLCSPYSKTEPWKAAVMLYNGSIYLSEIETDEAKKKTETQNARMKEMCYWGVKFEDYVTSSDLPTSVGAGIPSSPSLCTGTVNANRAFCTVVRTRMDSHSIVMAAEVDCCDHTSKFKPPQNYVELKTNRVILTDRNKSSFKRYKLMKWWAQSFLVGVPKIVCGFRDDDGIVKSLQHFKTSMMAHDSQNDLTMWQPAVCLNFLDELLSWIRKVVTSDGPSEVYVLEWTDPYTHVSCTKCPPNSEHAFLPDWFVKKFPPPP